MPKIRKSSPADIVPAARQPEQLELFRLLSADNFSNAFDFYEAMPRFVVARWDAHTVARNPDGTTAPIKRSFTFSGKRFAMTMSPAYIEQADGTTRAEFPGVKEELLELVLTKLATDRGYFLDAPADAPDSFVLFTTIHQISEELKRGAGGQTRSRSYSHAQIREGLQVLAKTSIHLRSEGDDDDVIFSPIADLGHFNDKTRAKLGPDVGKATIYIRFNSLISKAVLSRNWRQINYERIMSADKYLARRFEKLLGLRFTYAAPNKSFNIKLSTIIEGSGVTLYDRLSDNLKTVETALTSMPHVVARYAVEPEFTVHPKTGRGRILADAKIIIRPTDAFAAEQIKTNMHEHALDGAVVTEDGTVMLEPDQKQFPAFGEYHRAKTTYAKGRKLKPR